MPTSVFTNSSPDSTTTIANSTTTMTTHLESACQVLVVGGGTAGITVAARLRRKQPQLSLAIVEPSSKHYYQPLWTLVGAGVFPKEQSERAESAFIPENAQWFQEAIVEFQPVENRVLTDSGRVIRYEQLVVALGIQIDWNHIAGLQDSLGRGGVCSNYAYRYVDYTWECIRNFRGGTALFTMPLGDRVQRTGASRSDECDRLGRWLRRVVGNRFDLRRNRGLVRQVSDMQPLGLRQTTCFLWRCSLAHSLVSPSDLPGAGGRSLPCRCWFTD